MGPLVNVKTIIVSQNWMEKKREDFAKDRKNNTNEREKGHRKSTHTNAHVHKRKECDWKTAIKHCRWLECHRQLSLYRRTINMFLFFLAFKWENTRHAYGTYIANIIHTYNSLVLFRSCVKSQSTICHFNMSVSHIHHFIVLIVCVRSFPLSGTFLFR